MKIKHKLQKFDSLYLCIIFLSKIGNGLYFFVTTWLISILLNNPYATSYNLLASIIPTIFFSALIGNICDRFKASYLCSYADFTRSMILILFLYLIYFNKLTLLSGILLSFTFYLCSETQQIGWRAVISKNFNNIRLLRLNTFSVIGGQSGVVLGAASAGFISHYFGYYYILMLIFLIYLATSILTLLINDTINFRSNNLLSGKSTPTNYISNNNKSVVGILNYVKSNKRASFFYSIMLLNVLILYVINSTLSPFVNLKLNMDAMAFSMIDSSYSIGSILGGYIISHYFKKGSSLAILFSTFMLLTVALGIYGFSKNIYLPLVCYFTIGACSQNTILFLTLAQKATEYIYQARMYSIFNTATGIIGLIVYSTSPIIIKYDLYQWTFLFLSSLTLIILLLIMVIIFKIKLPLSLDSSA